VTVSGILSAHGGQLPGDILAAPFRVSARWLAGWLCVALAAATGACASVLADGSTKSGGLTPAERIANLRRARVWTATEIARRDLRAGPGGDGAFKPGETVTCTYVERKFRGRSPKFECAISQDDEIKVKYGHSNGEVFGELAATRLLWALGFEADRMYHVRLICKGCPPGLGGESGKLPGEVLFDRVAVERKAPGREIETHPDEGWAWDELDLVEEAAGGAPRAHRDALKLLAVFLQHGDNKPEQQRLVCRDREAREGEPESAASRHELCEHPVMLIQDLGLTFGRANLWDHQDEASVNFAGWSTTPVWKGSQGCVGNLPKSFTGSMRDPVISEAGRQFLSDLLSQLSDRQIRDLFDTADFPARAFAADSKVKSQGSLDDWVRAFKQKREDIATRRCDPAFVLTQP